MTYFLTDQPLHEGLTFTYRGEEAHHLLKSRRIRPGERFTLQDAEGRRHTAELVEVHRNQAQVRVLSAEALPPAPRRRVTLLQAAVKDKAAELILQKATELGAAAVVWFAAGHGTVPQHLLTGEKARRRWERITWEACKQCDRPAPPAMHVAGNLSAALAQAGQDAGQDVVRCVLHREAPPLAGVLQTAPDAPVHLLIGPEGGLTDEEVWQAQDAGFTPAALGPYTLRAETAAVAALGAVAALDGAE